ncbi:SGNH/GDSL hydrolase family protein [Nostoc sp. FACHB-888]|uniref:SGNH/GDSL hydrolase family protein n=1 Tax=Nostoc sp. FACHB-888 TaxID=2692842 RepID=UPI0016884C0F|nr:SGNH/GDSL hydrolase family protein [Nostoc sp. FACHB-888]MBD2249021.1 SGNH/GDSL hydrolase family protein [Nostoc sp. FACHB-888]
MLRNISLKTFTTAAVSSAAFLCISVNNAYAASFNSISRIYAFGDSYSDNGAALRITTAAVNSGVPGAFIFPRLDVYDSDGRWTNNPGLTSVEVLAKQENLQLTDYAIGGAKSGNGNLSTWLDQYQNTGLFGQIEQYKTEVNRVADSKALHFIFISSNDLLERFFYNQAGSVDVLADVAVDNIASGISQLAALGAKQFFVVNSTDLAALPLFEQYSQEAAKFRDVINKSLPGQLDTLNKQLGVEVALYDHVAISNKIRSTPATFGFTNINDACKLLYTTEGLEPGCSTPDNYYYFDEIHPTRRVHQIIGEDMSNFLETQKIKTVPEPSTFLACISCMIMISLLRRKVHSS